MKASRITGQQQRIADLLEENARNRWLVRNGHRAYGETAVRRVEVGVHTSSPRLSDRRARGSESHGGQPEARTSLLGVLGLIGLFIAASWLAIFGLVWLAIQVLRWMGSLVFGGGI